MATTKIINDLIDLNQTGNTTALKGCVGTNAQQPTEPTISVDYLVVGGGGGANGSGSGGGGAGGFSTGTIAVPNNTAVNIVIGQGGLGVLNNASNGLPAGQGQDSGFYTIQGQGGGAGVHRGNGLPGGSGAGAGVAATTVYSGGSGVSGQGNAGGLSSATWSAGGGGGAGAVGTNGISSQAGAGGVGSTTTIISTTNATTASVGEQNGGNLYFAGGGGGGGSDSAAGGNTLGGSGGLGGGGDGTGQCSNCPGGSATLNTGGGGGGSAAAAVDTAGGSGGSGVVILRYANTATETIAGSLAGGTTTSTTNTCNYPTTASILYQFEDNANNTCSGGTYDATAGANVSYSASGKYGKAVEFTASTASAADVITVPDAIANLIINDFTISFWMKPDNLNYASQGYVNPIGFQKGRRFYIDISSAGAISSYNGNSVLTSSDGVITTGAWFNVVYTQSSSTGRVLYVNGMSVASDGTTTDTTVYNPGGSENVIGGYKSSSAWGLMFDGLIDQFRLFPSVLTANQAVLLYAENEGATKFDDGTNTTLVFKAGSGTINLTDTSLPGPKVGDLRTNTDQTSGGSASAMEHYMSTGWRVFDNYSTLGVCNYPTTATALYQFENTPNATCGPNPSYTQYLTYNAGVPQFGSSYKALYFKGGAQNSGVGTEWLSSTAIIDSQQDASISFWVNFDAFGTGYQYLSTFYATGDMAIFMDNTGSSTGYSKIQGNVYNGASQWVRSPELVINTWYHVVFTRSTSSGMVLYIDGVQVDTNSSTIQPTNHGAYNDSIGCYGYTPAGTRTEFKGLIDQYRAFQSILTSAQVTKLYNE